MRFLLLLVFAMGAFAAPAFAESTAIFAGGCFWCMESEFAEAPGVRSVVSGFTGGKKANPTYEEVSTSSTGHAEAVEVHYDPTKIVYTKLLDIFWSNIDPTDGGGQFADRGSQYRPVIFTRNAEERKAAEASKTAVEAKLKRTVAVTIESASAFYAAEGYHQGYAKKNPLRYKMYKVGSGRPARLQEIWGPK